jgi:cysteine synthase
MYGTKQRELLEHPVFDPLRNHEQLTLAVTSDPFPPAFNPHFADGVEYRAVSAARGTINTSGKGMMARRAFYDGIEQGLITPETTVAEASSGNTGPEMEAVAMQLGTPLVLILQQSMPPPKLERARALAGGCVEVRLVPGGGAKLAREMGKQKGFYNPDQYRGGEGWNAAEQERSLAPQVFAGNEDAAALFVVGGSWGTAFGLHRFAKKRGLRTEVVPVVAAGRQDISGGKNMEQTEKDVLFDVFSTFPKESILRCPRDQATLLSWLSWPHVVNRSRGLQFMFGMSFWATARAAFEWVETQKRAGTLDAHRNSEGKVVVLTFGMDDFQGYTNIYLSELPDYVLNGPRVLPPLDELFRFGRVE